MDNLPSYANSTWNFRNLETKDSQLTVNKDDKNYCYFCFFIISAKCQSKACKFTFFVKVDDQSIYLTKGKSLTDSHGPNLKVRYLYQV